MGILPMAHARDARAASRRRFLPGAFDEDNLRRVIARSLRLSNQPLPTAPASISLAQVKLIATSLEDSLLAMTVAEAG